MNDKSINITLITNNYRNLREFFDINNDGDYFFGLEIDNGITVGVDSYLPFYYNGMYFVTDFEYLDLSFSEYEDYGIKNARITEHPGGIGGDALNSFVEELSKIFEAFKNSGIDGNTMLLVFMPLCLLKAFNQLYKNVNYPHSPIELVSFSNKRKMKLTVKEFVQEEELSQQDIDDINVGLSKIQELDEMGYFENVKSKDNNSVS